MIILPCTRGVAQLNCIIMYYRKKRQKKKEKEGKTGKRKK
jgi:hypothetical protein